MEDKPSYFAIIPANVRYNKKLTAYERLLYGEITALSNKTGECWASNNYFASLYEVTPQAISKMLGNLAKMKYITIELEYKNKQVVKRTIKLAGVSTYDLEVSKYDLEGYQHTIKENNTSNNNTSINKIIKEYENEIGLMKPYQLNILEGYLEEFSEDMIIESIHLASKYNKRNLAYIEGILKDWSRNEIKTLGDIKSIKNKKSDETTEERVKRILGGN